MLNYIYLISILFRFSGFSTILKKSKFLLKKIIDIRKIIFINICKEVQNDSQLPVIETAYQTI